tara:strand:+ start:534 stop:1682 length:1149 start_codon:yes stop_codon:yes gene_type:complete
MSNGQQETSVEETVDTDTQDLEAVETPTLDEATDSDVQLDEFKASGGDAGEVPDPKDSGKTTRSGDSKTPGEKAPTTKIGMINAMVEKMRGVKKDELNAAYHEMVKKLEGAHEDDEEDDDEQEESVKVSSKKITKEDIDVSQDIEAIFNSEDELTEDFKTKATVIFETAVISKVNEVLAKISDSNDAELAESKQTIAEELATKLDDYLDYVTGSWIEENKVAIERGIRGEISEDFLSGLKALFTEHYVEIPEEKVDVVEELVTKVDDLESDLKEQTENNIELNKTIKEFECENTFNSCTEGLTESEIAKFRDLAANVDFESQDDYKSKINIIKENYFKQSSEELSSEVNVDVDTPLTEEVQETEITGAMSNYVDTLSRSLKK